MNVRFVQFQRPPAATIVDTQEKADACGLGALFRWMNNGAIAIPVQVVEVRRLSLKQREQIESYRESEP